MVPTPRPSDGLCSLDFDREIGNHSLAPAFVSGAFSSAERSASPPRRPSITRAGEDPMSLAGSRTLDAEVSTGLRSDLGFLLTIFVLGRIFLFACAVLGSRDAPVAEGATIAQAMCTWDCNWYIDLAEDGYSGRTDVDASALSNWAFFPVLPLLVRAASALTGADTTLAGVVVANLLSAAGLLLFHRYARHLFGRDFARFAAVIFVVWPFAIHASVPMSEAVFVPVSLLTLLAARRGHWLVAGVAAAVLSGTRAVGVLVFLPMALLAVRQYGFTRLIGLRPGTERAVLALALSGLGLGLFMVYLHFRVGDALAFSHDQTAWNRRFVWPWMMIFDTLVPHAQTTATLLVNAAIVATVAAGLAAAVMCWRRGLAPEALFAAAPLVVALNSGSVMSLPRFVGSLFPVVLALALVADRPRWRIAVVGVCVVLQVVATVGWVEEWYYVM
jgi:hypothetical protein